MEKIEPNFNISELESSQTSFAEKPRTRRSRAHFIFTVLSLLLLSSLLTMPFWRDIHLNSTYLSNQIGLLSLSKREEDDLLAKCWRNGRAYLFCAKSIVKNRIEKNSDNLNLLEMHAQILYDEGELEKSIEYFNLVKDRGLILSDRTLDVLCTYYQESNLYSKAVDFCNIISNKYLIKVDRNRFAQLSAAFAKSLWNTGRYSELLTLMEINRFQNIANYNIETVRQTVERHRIRNVLNFIGGKNDIYQLEDTAEDLMGIRWMLNQKTTNNISYFGIYIKDRYLSLAYVEDEAHPIPILNYGFLKSENIEYKSNRVVNGRTANRKAVSGELVTISEVSFAGKNLKNLQFVAFPNATPMVGRTLLKSFTIENRMHGGHLSQYIRPK
jgi:hypothetical protein